MDRRDLDGTLLQRPEVVTFSLALHLGGDVLHADRDMRDRVGGVPEREHRPLDGDPPPLHLVEVLEVARVVPDGGTLTVSPANARRMSPCIPRAAATSSWKWA